MASLDLSQNGPSINRSYKALVESPPSKNPSPTHASWALFTVSPPLQNAFMQGPPKDSVVKVQSTGEGELSELIEEFSEGKVQFAFVKVKDPNTGLAKFVLIGWCGEGVPERVKGYFTGHLAAISKVLHGYHVQITARSESHLSPESIIQKVADSSGAKYSAATAPTTTSTRPPPPTAAKPVYTPSVTKGTSRSAAYGYKPSGQVDNDGWGEDAPQVTRSKLESVQSAYVPTRVDIAALKAMPSSTTSGLLRSDDRPDVVRGAYIPVGKVDIAAIRAASRTKEDRPEPVKGAYQPVGKVDIAAIRAQSRPQQESREEEAPKPVSERMAAYSSPTPQAERLTSLPKPKPAKKFGTGAPSFGTKPLTPGGFTAVPTSAPVGTANKDFASQGGKTPAQLWAEKKARERGEDPSAALSVSTTSTGSQPRQAEEEEPKFSGVGALKSKFAGAPPMGAQYSGRSARSASPPPPSPPRDRERPSIAGAGAIAMPGFPPRTQPQETAAPPPPPPQPPRSPTPPSPRTPVVPSSPVRIAMPVGRGREESEPVPKVPEEPKTSLPVESLSRAVPKEEEIAEDEPARERGHAAVEASGGIRARVEYDYEKAEGNEIDLVEGEIVMDIDMVDDDWWAGTNSRGETGLFPSNYVTLLEEEQPAAADVPPPMAPRPVPEPQPEPEPQQSDKPSAIAQYDYEAAEGNEISFPEGAIIEDIEFPDDDWWEGTYNGQRGLFPANYVELRQ